jgi:branched-chain amino acid transport system permease protein
VEVGRALVARSTSLFHLARPINAWIRFAAMPSFDQLYPFLILGFAFGALYAVAGAGLVVLYRTTGVLNFAFGAIGMFALNISWTFLQANWWPDSLNWFAYLLTVILSILLSLAYGRYIAPLFAQREPLVKTVGTLGLLLLLLGITFVRWETQNGRSYALPLKSFAFNIGRARINGVHLLAFGFGVLVTLGVTFFLNKTDLGTAMRAVANDRDVAALIGIPVRKVEATAWAANGFICGVVALCAASLSGFEVINLTYIVIPYLAAALIGRLKYLGVTFAAGLVIGVLESSLNPFGGNLRFLSDYRTTVPFVLCILSMLWFGRKRTIVLAGREMQ